MEKYPLLLKSGKECAILEGFGQRTSLLIDQKLAALASAMKCTVEEALSSENERLLKEKEKSQRKKKPASRKRPLPDDVPGPSSPNQMSQVPGSAAKVIH